MSDSEFVYAHRSTRLHYIERQCAGVRETLASAALQVALSPSQADVQHACLIATEPLTPHETWLPMPVGEVAVFHRGRRIR